MIPERPAPVSEVELAKVEAKPEKPVGQNNPQDSAGQSEPATEDSVTTTLLRVIGEMDLDKLASQGSGNSESDVYKVQVASFRSKEIADLTANSLRESGYQITESNWRDEKGEEWHRLFTGPFVTKDEALTSKVKIEMEYSLGPMVVQSKAVKAATEESTIPAQSTEKIGLESIAGVRIEISNGNGVNRMARRVGDYLKSKGLKVVRLTNADNFNYSGTAVFYCSGFGREADCIAGQLEVLEAVKEIKKLDRPNINVKVLIGKDLIPRNKTFEADPQS